MYIRGIPDQKLNKWYVWELMPELDNKSMECLWQTGAEQKYNMIWGSGLLEEGLKLFVE